MDDQVKTVVPGTLILNYQDTIVNMFVPPSYRFGQLLIDGTRYFQVDKNMVHNIPTAMYSSSHFNCVQVALEDEEGRMWASEAIVQDEMSLTLEFKEGRTPTVFIRNKVLLILKATKDFDS